MWMIYALLSAGFAGANTVLAKYGIQKVNTTVATALRTVVVLGVSFSAVALTGAWRDLHLLGARSVLYLGMAGAATGAAWLCYFRALSAGSVNRVAAVDKFSTVLTMLGGWLLLGESMTGVKIVSMILISVGIVLMIEKESNEIDKAELAAKRSARKGWLFWAALSVILVSAAALFSKACMEMVSAELALAVRTGFVLILTWAVVLCRHKTAELYSIKGKALLFIVLSGLATGLGWLCYFRALVHGEAGVVHPIDKLSILVTVILSRILFWDKLTGRAIWGLVALVAGILTLLFGAY